MDRKALDIKALLACLLVSFVFGVLHAFSLYVVPLETLFGAGRAATSFTYSLAVLTLAFAVMQGHRVYGRWPARAFLVGVLLLGAVGLVLASLAGALWQVWLFYGVVFGAANGLGYGFALQFAGRVWPTRVGMAMGLVTAAYATGAAVSPPALNAAILGFGPSGALQWQAMVYVLAAPVVWVLLAKTEVRFSSEPRARLAWRPYVGVWLAYGLAVFAGLMVLSQSSEVLRQSGASGAFVVAGPMVASGAGLFGSLIGGWVMDKMPARVLLIALPFASALVLAGMAGVQSVGVVAMGVGLTGFFYGATISVYPAWIAQQHVGAKGIAVYGIVFTAWGLSGVVAPWLAGLLFDLRGAYMAALMVAAVLALGSGALHLTRRV